MKTGIEFFDNASPVPGDVWFFLGRSRTGKTTLLRNLIRGVFSNDIRSVYYHPKETSEQVQSWRRTFLRDDPDKSRLACQIEPCGVQRISQILQENSTQALFIDDIDVFCGAGGKEVSVQVLAELKSYAVRMKTFIVLSQTLNSNVTVKAPTVKDDDGWWSMMGKGEDIPSWMTAIPDRVFVTSELHQCFLLKGERGLRRLEHADVEMFDLVEKHDLVPRRR